jgi:hypothetical protein
MPGTRSITPLTLSITARTRSIPARTREISGLAIPGRCAGDVPLEQQDLDPVRVDHLRPGRPGEQRKPPVL